MRISAAVTLGLLGCGADAPDPIDPEQFPEDSLYRLHADLVDHAGERPPLSLFAGHPVVVSMIYTSCPTACPALISDLRQLESELSPEARAEVRVLLVSLDPERDGPKELNALAVAHELDLERWRLVRAPDLQMRGIAEALDVSFKKRADGEMDHSTLLALYDREGRKVTTHHGLGSDTTAFRARIEGLVRQGS
jgi:protein SCO1/2